MAVVNCSSPTHPPLCPLCGKCSLQTVEITPLEDLRREYLRQFGVDVAPEFPPEADTIRLQRCPECGLESYHPLVAGSPDFYRQLAARTGYYTAARWEFLQTADRLRADERVVDVGCGDGHFLSLVPQADKLGLEFNVEAIRRAKARGVPVEEGDIGRLPAESVDAITLFQVLEHIADPVSLLERALSVLRPGGRLFVAVPNNDDFVGEAIQEPLNAPPHHPLRWRRAALEFIPSRFPLKLKEILVEPLHADHLFLYRRTRITRFIGKLAGRPLPLLRLTPGTILARKVANALVMISMRMAPKVPKSPGSGHSYLAIYEKLR